MKALELEGQQINDLLIIARDYTHKKGRTWWLCECQNCKEQFVLGADKIKRGQKSCGCNLGEDLSNQRFGHLIALHKVPLKENEKTRKWLCKCDCGATVEVLAASLKNHLTTSCGCIKSKGEDTICKLLTEAQISFEREKTFDNCRFPETNKLARFDFYVNNSYIIEFDGKQHFQSYGSGWFTSEIHQKVIQHDNFKNEWCKKNNIPIIRIPYTMLEQLTLNDLIYKKEGR